MLEFFSWTEGVMKERSLLKSFLVYVCLNILGQAAFSCYTMADTFFVSSKLGTNGLTALNIAFPIFCVISGIGLMIGMGAGTRFSIAKNRTEIVKSNSYFTNAIYLIIFFSIIFMFLGAFSSGHIAKLLGADEVIFPYANTYLKTMMLFAPAFMFNHLLQCFVRNDGKPMLSMGAMITGSLANILLDYIFIFPLDMGIFGAILATGLSPLISMLIISPYILMRKNNFHIQKELPNFKKRIELSSSGIPSLVTEFSSGIIMFLFNFLILRLEGNVGVAAFGIVTVISLVVVAIFTGLSQGIQPLMSSNYGQGEITNVKKIYRYSLITLLILASSIYLIIFFGAESIINIFNSENDPYLKELSTTGLKLYFIAAPFIGFNIVSSTFLTSCERNISAQTISLLRGLFILLPITFLLSYTLEMLGIWLAYPISEGIVSIVALVLIIVYLKSKKQDRKVQD